MGQTVNHSYISIIFALQHFFYRLSRDEYIKITKVIKKTFPTEDVGTYYIPSDVNGQARGKLFSAYKHWRDLLSEANLVTKRAKKRKLTESSGNTAENDDVPPNRFAHNQRGYNYRIHPTVSSASNGRWVSICMNVHYDLILLFDLISFTFSC